ncbi:spore germination protein GerPE [Ectobacillus sp. sgz5001026]|uniref:spore germination protein GerPE n=1 Tax=Ectobacillus sp. sgz5001026 TaxID=3242473 RepID=UPI0036D24C3C
MFSRFSVVDQINITSLGLDGVTQLGDTNTIAAKNRAVAIQKEGNQFSLNVAPLTSFSMFTDYEITIPTRRKEVRLHTINECPFIHVNQITVTFIQSAAVFHVGNVDYVFTNSRLLQIRQFE